MTENEMLQRIEELKAENENLRCVMKDAYQTIKNNWESFENKEDPALYKLLQYLHGKHRRVSHQINPYPQHVESVRKSKVRYVSWASDSTLSERLEDK